MRFEGADCLRCLPAGVSRAKTNSIETNPSEARSAPMSLDTFRPVPWRVTEGREAHGPAGTTTTSSSKMPGSFWLGSPR